MRVVWTRQSLWTDFIAVRYCLCPFQDKVSGNELANGKKSPGDSKGGSVAADQKGAYLLSQQKISHKSLNKGFLSRFSYTKLTLTKYECHWHAVKH